VLGNSSITTTALRGNVGVGNTSPSYKLDVSGTGHFTGQLTSTLATGTSPFAVTSTTVNTNLNADMLDGLHSSSFQTTLTNPVTGTGTTNYLPKFTGASTIGNSLISDNGTNVTVNNGGLVLSSTSGQGLSGAGLSDCSSINSKLLWNSSTKQFSCGTDGTGSALVTISKSANQTSTLIELQNDNSFNFNTEANSTYIFDLTLDLDITSGGIGYQFDIPTGADCYDSETFIEDDTQDYAESVSNECGSYWSYTTTGSYGIVAHMTGTIRTGANGGLVRFLWGQDSGPSGTLTMFGQSSALLVYKQNGADLAETYYTKDTGIKAGDIVSIDPYVRAGVKKTNIPYDTSALGIVSTHPGVVLANNDNTDRTAIPVMLALAGRVPVKVSTENGAIHAGDYLTTSSIPGVAMKATHAGQMIGKALGEYTNTNQNAVGTILTFVNLGYADPNMTITSTGNIGIFDQTELDNTNTLITKYAIKDTNGKAINQTSVSSDAVIGNLKAGGIDTQKLVLAGKDVNGIIANNESQIMNLETRTASIEAQQLISKDKIASLEANLQMLMNNPLGNFTASTPAELNLDKIDIKDATIAGTLSVIGRTTVADLGVTGRMTIGLLGIDGLDAKNGGGYAFASINTSSGPLKIQSDGFNGVDFINGKVTIATNGDMKVGGIVSAKAIKTEKLNITEDTNSSPSAVLSSSAGTVTIPAGDTTIDVNTSALTNKSLIFATPESPIGIGAKAIDSNTFRIKLQQVQTVDVKVNWWIVN
jgi:hypothetical protein